MSTTHDGSNDLDTFHFAGDAVDVDVYYEFYSFQLGADFSLSADAHAGPSTKWPLQTMWMAVENSSDATMTGLTATTDEVLERLVAEMARIALRVMSALSAAPLPIFQRASEFNAEIANASRVRRFVSLLEESTSVRVVRGSDGTAKKKHLETLGVERDPNALRKLRFALRIRPLGAQMALMTSGDPTLIFDGAIGTTLIVQCLGNGFIRSEVLGEDARLEAPGRLASWIQQRVRAENS